MPFVASHEKELRFALLSLFPSAGLKEVSEAAKSGNFDLAVEILRAREVAEHAAEPAEPAEPTKSKRLLDSPEVSPKEKFGSARADTGVPESESEGGIAPEVLTEVLAAAKSDSITSQKQGNQGAGGYRTQDGWEIRCHVDHSQTCQSLRTLQSQSKKTEDAADTILRHVGTDNTAAFAAVCFEKMMQREQEMDEGFCVFYHHYNGAALLYEVQAEIARYAFDLPDTFAPLPRVLLGHFANATLQHLQTSFASASLQGQDHDPWFRSLAISASPTLFAFGSEAPPLHCFREGYGCTDLSFRGLLTSLLKDVCKIHIQKAQDLVRELSDVGARQDYTG